MLVFSRLRQTERSQQRWQSQQRIISEHQDLLAAMSWWGFSSAGRGVLVLPPPSGIPLFTPSRWKIGHEQVTYISGQHLALVKERLPSGVATVISTMLSRYIPTDEMVVIFLSSEGSIDAYRLHLDSNATPPSAFRRWQTWIGANS